MLEEENERRPRVANKIPSWWHYFDLMIVSTFTQPSGSPGGFSEAICGTTSNTKCCHRGKLPYIDIEFHREAFTLVCAFDLLKSVTDA